MTRSDREIEEALEPFFASARRTPPTPRTELLNAIIADAAELQTAREAAATEKSRPAPERPRWRPLWRPAMAAAATCLAAGFLLGYSGMGDMGVAAVYGAAEGADDPSGAMDAFYELALAEG